MNKMICLVFAVTAALATPAYAQDYDQAYSPADIPESSYDAKDMQVADRCCRICSAGKACGDSCIARTSECHRPAGCACNAQ